MDFSAFFSAPFCVHGGMLRLGGVDSVDLGWTAGWQRDDSLLEEGAVELSEGEFNAKVNQLW